MANARVLKGGWYWGGRKRQEGDELEASDRQIAAWAADGYVERIDASMADEPDADEPAPEDVEGADEADGDPEVDADAEDGEADDTEPREWPHKMSPAQYAARFPEGPDADLARSLTAND